MNLHDKTHPTGDESPAPSPQELFSKGLGTLITQAAQSGVSPDYVMTELEIQKLYAFEAFKRLAQNRVLEAQSPIIVPPRN